MAKGTIKSAGWNVTVEVAEHTESPRLSNGILAACYRVTGLTAFGAGFGYGSSAELEYEGRTTPVRCVEVSNDSFFFVGTRKE